MNESQIAEKWAELILQRLNELEQDWKKTWVTSHIKIANISGRQYKGCMNIFMLLLDSMFSGFDCPIYMTPNQAIKLELNFKGASTVPVISVNHTVEPKERKYPKITLKEYDQLNKEEKQHYWLNQFISSSNVMNIGYTDYADKYPDRWAEILKLSLFEHTTNIEPLDQLVNQQAWYCPIREQMGAVAAFSPSEDYIMLPHRKQFPDINKFYSTMLHEMTHSTGIPSRLKRQHFDNYPYEELVAELGAIFSGLEFHVNREIDENNLAYIKHWHKEISSDPKYIQEAVKDALKATQMIVNKVRELTPEINIKKETEQSQREKIMQNLNQELIFDENNPQSHSKQKKFKR